LFAFDYFDDARVSIPLDRNLIDRRGAEFGCTGGKMLGRMLTMTGSAFGLTVAIALPA
jgi:hypothetical protein